MARETSVYVHFPWCRKKCPYCDFVSYKTDDASIPHRAYLDAVCRELDARAPALQDRQLVSIFLGGGTPSLWQPTAVGSVVRAIRSAFGGREDSTEITLECNPSSIDRQRVAEFVDQGINRFSIGIQSTRDRQLKFLGRLHDSQQALSRLREAVEVAPRVSADLMFGMPGQSAETFDQELSDVLDTGVEHLSVYALTIEPGTQFGELSRRGKLTVANEETYAATFEMTRNKLIDAGFTHYEVSNYARPGQESRHNQHYWRGGDYLGLGTGAVGCLASDRGRAIRYRNAIDPNRYIDLTATRPVDDLEDTVETLDADTMLRESLMLGLRTLRGVDVVDTRHRTGIDPQASRRPAIERHQQRGNLEYHDGCLRVPPSRWLYLDSIVADLF